MKVTMKLLHRIRMMAPATLKDVSGWTVELLVLVAVAGISGRIGASGRIRTDRRSNGGSFAV